MRWSLVAGNISFSGRFANAGLNTKRKRETLWRALLHRKFKEAIVLVRTFGCRQVLGTNSWILEIRNPRKKSDGCDNTVEQTFLDDLTEMRNILFSKYAGLPLGFVLFLSWSGV